MKERPDNQLSPQELLERDQKLLEALCIDYTAVYYCNLAKNTMEPIKRSVHYTTFSGGTTVERFKRYLETDLLPHLNGNSILVMDNMKSHHAKAVKELLDSSGVRYIYPLSFRTLSALVRVGTEKHKGKIYCFPFSFPASKRGI